MPANSILRQSTLAMLLFACLVGCARTCQIAPPPEVPTISNSGPMREAFLSFPLQCRIAVQKELKGQGLLHGAPNGAWTRSTAAALAAYVGSLGNLAYNWVSASGSKTILVGIVVDSSICSPS